MHAPSRRTQKITALAAGPVAVLLAGALVWQGSTAAFTATTRNSGNEWSTGSVILTDDDQGRAGFTVENLLPGQSGEKCIVVTSGSTVPGEVRSYVQNLATSGAGLADHIVFQVEQGTGGSFDDCTGFTPGAGALPAQPISALAASNVDFTTGGAAWATTGTPGESNTYRGTWTFDTTGLTQAQIDALQGASISLDLVWELQSA